MHVRGERDENIAAARDGAYPVRALWPHECDPHELAHTTPLVFVIANNGDPSRRFFCGYDPITEKSEPYDYK